MPDQHSDPGILRARENISELKIAIRKERDTLADYRERLASGRGGFPEAGLRHGIERCDHNIAVLKAAIIKERANILTMKGQRDTRDELAKLQVGMAIAVEVEEDSEGGDVGTD